MKETKNKLTTSKLALLAVFLLSIQIIIFCEIMINKYGDLSAMYALIGIPATIIPIVLGYYSKSKAENTAGGITYDMAMMEMSQRQQDDNDAVG